MGKWFERIPMVFGIWGWVLATAWGVSTSKPEVTAAIQAIQQAPDPSATVAAYVNGAAVDRNDPKLSEAYVVRMVDLGLPELAFHQAQTLTTLESNNGLAWGVIAYVEARRGNMPEAISAINLAGQFAPDNPLVERTAGEIIAWYDVKADKAAVSENAQHGLATIRGLPAQLHGWPFSGCSLHLEFSKSDNESIRTTIFTNTTDRFDGSKFRYGSQLCQVWHDRGSPQKWLRWWA